MKAHEHRVGTHSVYIEGDILRMRWVGDVEAQDMSVIHSYLEGMFSEHEQVFMLVDASSGRGLTLEARKRGAAWPHAHRLAGAAVFGARITARAAATILTAMMKILYPASAIALEFTTTEAAARAWIDARRRQARSGGSASGA